MRILVIGRAKTGTTALAHLLAAECGGLPVIMEPPDASAVPATVAAAHDGIVVKVLYDHFHDQPHLLHALIEQSQFDAIAIVRRDLRDELVSRLLYYVKPHIDMFGRTGFVRPWLALLREKEQKPASVSFRELVEALQDLTGDDCMRVVVDAAFEHAAGLEKFAAAMDGQRVHDLQYEALVRGEETGLAGIVGHPVTMAMGAIETGKYTYTRRSGTSGAWRSFMTVEDRAFLEERYGQYGLAVPDDWEFHTVHSLPSQDYSHYVKRMVGEASHPVRRVKRFVRRMIARG